MRADFYTFSDNKNLAMPAGHKHVTHPNSHLTSSEVGSWSTDEYWRLHGVENMLTKATLSRLTVLPKHRQPALQPSTASASLGMRPAVKMVQTKSPVEKAK